MDLFFVYSRDAPGTEALRADRDLLEEHWSYMDAFAEGMIARGPTFAADGKTVTGSLHVLELPGVEAAHEFVVDEPNNRAGVYAEHSIWRFENLLGRTMWEFQGSKEEPCFLVIAHIPGGHREAPKRLPQPLARLSTELRERLILYGALSELDRGEPNGVALALQAAGREDAERLLRTGGAQLDVDPTIEIHAWEFGGRR